MAPTPELASPPGTDPALGRSYERLRPGPGLNAEDVAAQQCRRLRSAMVELAAARGYDSVTVRDLSSLAGVSTRAFYQHFSGKEECLVSAYETLARCSARQVVAAQAGERDWARRLRLAFRAFAAEVGRDPAAARLALVEIYTGGSSALQQVWRMERAFEAVLADCLSPAGEAAPVSPAVVEGIVAGTASVARSQLLGAAAGETTSLGDALTDWALCYCDSAAAKLPALDRVAAAEVAAPAAAARPGSPGPLRKRAQAAYGGDAPILAALAELVVADGYDQLTASRIRDAAGVSRRCFAERFESVEQCFLTAIERHARAVFARVARARRGPGPWAAGMYRAMGALCAEVARDPVFARLCLVEIFAAGAAGMSCCRRLSLEFADLLAAEEQPADGGPTPLAVEATAAAILGVLRQEVHAGRAHQVQRLAATLSFLATASAVGPAAAVKAIRYEQRSRSACQAPRI